MKTKNTKNPTVILTPEMRRVADDLEEWGQSFIKAAQLIRGEIQESK